MSQNKFVCVVLNYNDAETTLEMVNRIKEYKNIGHIIIIDNCSVDNSVQILEECKDDKTSIILAPKNGGYGAGNNYGLEYAIRNLGYRFVLISNPDVFFEDSVLNSMLDVFEENDKCAIVAPVQLDRNENIINDYAWKIPSKWEYIVTSELIFEKMLKGYHYDKDFLKEGDKQVVDCVPGAFLGLDVSKFQNGFYDEEFFLYCEELVIGLKVKKEGFQTVLLTKERYKHMHAVSVNKSIASVREQRRILTKSKILFLKKYLEASKFELFVGKLFFVMSDLEACINEKIKKVFLGLNMNVKRVLVNKDDER